MKLDQKTPSSQAAWLLTWLQEAGAVCRIDGDGYLKIDLNPVRCIKDKATAEAISRIALSLREEIKALLRAEKVVHQRGAFRRSLTTE